MFDFRLRAYEPNGVALGLLPEPLSVTVSFVHNDDGALRVEYSTLAAGGSILERGLEQGLEVGVEVSTGDGWVEPANGRFLLLARDGDNSDAVGKVTLTLPSYSWMLRKAGNLDASNLLPADHNQAGKRAFLSANAGVILGTLLQENSARSGIALGRGFTSARDSADVAWGKVATLYYDLGLDLWTILNNLALQGMVDWRTQGRELRLWNVDTVCAPDVSGRVRLWMGRDVGEAPFSESLEDVVGRVLIRGEDGLTLSEDNPSAPSPWGVWEGFISQGGVADKGTARSLVQADLERGGRVRGQYTRSLIGLEHARFVPLADYVPGSWITAPTTGTGERVRVQQVTLTKDQNGIGGSLVLNDRVLDAELRRARRVTGIVGGSQKDGGSGVRPSPEGPDKRTPAAPQGLVVASNAYIDKDGNPRGLIFAEWDQVTTATDGTLLEVASYEFAIRENVTGAPWKTVRSTDTTTVDYSPLPVGSEQLGRVRARGRYATTPGVWSDIVPVLVAEDTTPPPIPSDPVLSTKLGTVTVKWDGETDIGTQMPLDFDVVRVYQQGVEEPIGSLRETGGSDFLVVTDLVWGEPARFRFTSVDTSGNESEPTSWVSVTPVGVVDEDLVETTILDTIEEIENQVDYAVESADSKNRNYFGPNPPSAPEGGFKPGDTWFDASDPDGVVIRTWDGTGWVVQGIGSGGLSDAISDAIADAVQQSDYAVQAVDGKNTNYYGPNLPTAPEGGFTPGDTWFDASDPDGPVIKTWDGTGWVTQRLGPEGISEAIRDAIDEANQNADQAVQAANGKNTIYRGPTTPTAPPGGFRTGDTWFDTAGGATTIKTWTGTTWTIQEVGEESLAVGAITAESGIVASLDAGKISTGVLDADRIGAKTITAEKLLIGRPRDLAPGPGGYEELWDLGSAATIAVTTLDPSGRQIRIDPTGPTVASRSAYGPIVPVREGENIEFNAYASTAVAGVTANWSTFIYWYDSNGNPLASPERTAVTTEAASGGTSGWSRGTVTAPAGARFARVRFYSAVQEAPVGYRAFMHFDIQVQLGATLIEDGAITTDKIAANTITANEIQTGTITAESGIIASLDAGIISTGVLDADRIGANTITAGKLIMDAAFAAEMYANRILVTPEDFAPGPAGFEDAYDLIRASIVTNSLARTGKSFRFSDTTNTGQVRGPLLPAREGQSFYLEATVGWHSSSTTGGSVHLRMEWFDDPDAARIGQSIAASIAEDVAVGTISGTVTAPEGTSWGRLYIWVSTQTGPGDRGVRNVICRPQTGETLIEPGAITTEKIRTGAITAESGIIASLDAGIISTGVLAAGRIGAQTITGDKLVIGTVDTDRLADGAVTATVIRDGAVTTDKVVANAITTSKIAANAVTAAKILAGSITTVKLDADAVTASRLDADAITAKHTITGATIQTTATNNRGIKLTATNLSAYDATGTRTFYVNAATGDVVTVGSLQTGVGSNQTYVADNVYNGRPGIRFNTGTSADVQPVIYSLGAGASGYSAGALVMNGRETTTNSSGRSDLVLEHGGDFKLAQQYGTNANIGIHKTGRYLLLRGRDQSASYSSSAHTVTNSIGPYENNTNALKVDVTHTPVPVGTRTTIATAVQGTGASDGFRAQVATVSADTASGFTVVVATLDGNNSTWRRVNYASTWM